MLDANLLPPIEHLWREPLGKLRSATTEDLSAIDDLSVLQNCVGEPC